MIHPPKDYAEPEFDARSYRRRRVFRYPGRAADLIALFVFLWVVLFSAALILTLVFTVTRARAHDAVPTTAQPLGWTYPWACCSGLDCRAAAPGEVRETPRGYEIAGTGEIVPMTDKRVKDSPDGLFHWCAHRAGLDAGKTICLFVPSRGF